MEVNGSVEFEDVYFNYPTRPGEQGMSLSLSLSLSLHVIYIYIYMITYGIYVLYIYIVLKGLSLQIQPNQITALVGDSGGGKSTITKLLLRLYDPAMGKVKIDGVDLTTLDLKCFHEQIAIVSQNPDLFNCSLAENIAYGALKPPSREQIIQAAKLANCHDFIMNFRGGYDTFAGARGNQLSGGQKQRLAIARAAIRDPKILILDEATSALDAENERLVQEALERIMKGRTIIVIAHRLSTIKNAHEIICMKAGKAVEKGSHQELMSLKGSYHNLVTHQLQPVS